MMSDLWTEYARIQHAANSPLLNDKAWGIDNALEAILDHIKNGQLVSSNQADNLVTNRTAKYRQRRTILSLGALLQTKGTLQNELGQSLAWCILRQCAAQYSQREWQLLLSVAFGETYSEIATRYGIPEGTVKIWVSRARRGSLAVG